MPFFTARLSRLERVSKQQRRAQLRRDVSKKSQGLIGVAAARNSVWPCLAWNLLLVPAPRIASRMGGFLWDGLFSFFFFPDPCSRCLGLAEAT